MSRVARGGAGLAVLALLLAAPPLLLRSAWARAQFETRAGRALGREVSVEGLRWGWWPPRLVVLAPRLAGGGPGAAPLLEAPRLVLHPELPPLLRGTLRFRSGLAPGARVALVRGAGGLSLPPALTGSGPRPSAAGAAGSGRAGLALGALELSDARLEFEDRAAAAPVRWGAELVRASLVAEGPDRPLRLAAELRFPDGGRLEFRGARTADLLGVELAASGLDLALVRPYLDKDTEVSGRVSGELRLSRVGGRLAALSLDAQAADAELRLEDARVRGPVGLRVRLAAGAGAASGSFDVDASGAALDFGGAYRKPPGEAARLQGRVEARPGGRLGLGEIQLKIGPEARAGPPGA